MLNKTIIMGRLTADPELRQTQSGTPVCGFTVAINRPPKQGTTQAQADFIDVVAWSKSAEFLVKYFKKGNMIAVVGRLQTRSYEKDGKKVKVTEVVAEELNFCEGRRDNETQPVSRPQQPQPSPQPATSAANPVPRVGAQPINTEIDAFPDFAPLDGDTDLPF